MPSHVQEHVDYVTPGTRLRKRSTGGKDSQRKKRSDLKNGNIVRPEVTQLPGFPNPNATTCDRYVTAECTRGKFTFSPSFKKIGDSTYQFPVQYNLPNGTTACAGNELGIFESLDDHYSRADLDVFFATLYP